MSRGTDGPGGSPEGRTPMCGAGRLAGGYLEGMGWLDKCGRLVANVGWKWG